MSNKWTCEVYHVNIGVGDSTIVLSKDENKNIASTVLIDGGMSQDCWRYKIVPALKFLEVKQIDAVVVTHYDKDHVIGINSLLKEVVGETEEPKDGWRKYISVGVDKDGNKVNTRFYDLGFSDGDAKDALTYKRLVKQAARNNLISHFTPFFKTRPIKGEDDTDDHKETNKEFQERMRRYEMKGVDDFILGKEFFWDLHNNDKYKHAPNLEKLLELHGLPDGVPGLFCIGVNRQVIGDVRTRDSNQITVNIFPPPSNDKFDTNPRSICLILVGPSGRIVHYLGGDLRQTEEVPILKWILGSPFNDENKGCIETIKLSHHGASYSTPTAMFDSIKPKYMIDSVGESHNHPSWEVYTYSQVIDNYKGVFIATQYPNYFAKQRVGPDLVYPAVHNFATNLVAMINLIRSKIGLSRDAEEPLETLLFARKMILPYDITEEDRQKYENKTFRKKLSKNFTDEEREEYEEEKKAYDEERKEYLRKVRENKRELVDRQDIMVPLIEHLWQNVGYPKEVEKLGVSKSGKPLEATEIVKIDDSDNDKSWYIHNVEGIHVKYDEKWNAQVTIHPERQIIPDPTKDDTDQNFILVTLGTPISLPDPPNISRRGLTKNILPIITLPTSSIEMIDDIARDFSTKMSEFTPDNRILSNRVSNRISDPGAFTVIYTPASSTTSVSKNVSDSDFKIFMSLLPYQNINLTHCLVTEGNPWSISGTVSDSLSEWFRIWSPWSRLELRIDQASNIDGLKIMTKDVNFNLFLHLNPSISNSDTEIQFSSPIIQNKVLRFTCKKESQVGIFEAVSFNGFFKAYPKSTLFKPFGDKMCEMILKSSYILFDPYNGYRIKSVINLLIPDTIKFPFMNGLAFKDLTLCITKEAKYGMNKRVNVDHSVIFRLSIQVGDSSAADAYCNASIKICGSTATVNISLQKGGNTFGVIGSFLKKLGVPDSVNLDLLPQIFEGIGVKIRPVKNITMYLDLNNSNPLSSARVMITGDITIQEKIHLQVTLLYPEIILSGQLSVGSNLQIVYQPGDPTADFSDYNDQVVPILPQEECSMDILFPNGDVQNRPFRLDGLTLGLLEVSVDLRNKIYSLQGSLKGSFLLFEVVNMINLSFLTRKSEQTFLFKVSAEAYMGNVVAEIQVTYTRDASITDKNSSWNIEGHIGNLHLTDLIDSFDPYNVKTIMEYVPKIEINDLGFTHDTKEEYFNMWGDIIIAEFFECRLDYLKRADAQIFRIIGENIDKEPVSIKSMLDHFGIPTNDFMDSIHLPFNAIFLEYGFSQSYKSKGTLVVGASGDTFSVLIARIKPTSDTTKTVVKITFSPLSVKSGFPMVGSFEQPFDQLCYIYTSDDLNLKEVQTINALIEFNPGQGMNFELMEIPIKSDITSDIVVTKGSHLQAVINLGPKKEILDHNFTPTPTPSPSGPKENSVSSLKNPESKHMFPASTWQPSLESKYSDDSRDTTSPLEHNPLAAFMQNKIETVELDSLKSTPDPPTWMPVQKTVGPLTIEKFGLSYSDGRLWILLSAIVKLGPISIELIDLGLGISISPFKWTPTFRLSGLGVQYVQSPLTIAGTFDHKDASGDVLERYEGGVVITIPPYTVTAAGAYVRSLPSTDSHGNPVEPEDRKEVIDFFIFGRLNAPLGGPPFAYVTGLAAGFGFNQRLRIPTQDTIIDFPLVRGSSNPATFSGENPLDVLRNLEGEDGKEPWVMTADGEKWIAVGIDFTSFELVDTRALLVVEFGGEFSISLLAQSTCSLPKSIGSNQNSGGKFLYVKMGLVATIQPAKGFWGVSAVLSNDSYVLDPNCHLTGGFAISNWFGNNPNAGDFVITIGGYHPSYVVTNSDGSPGPRPTHYPNEERIGFRWKYSDQINISGGCYFALTPSCAMGGGGLEVVFESSGLRAWFTAHANLIVYWHPFFFEGDADISIGASYHLNLAFTSINLSVELGASLKLWGPPLAGEVHVHWWVIGFTIEFGPDKKNQTDPIEWEEFVRLVIKKENDNKLKASEDGTKSIGLIKIIVERGLIPEKGGDSENGKLKEAELEEVWKVSNGKFRFRTETAIPATALIYNGDQPVDLGRTFNLKPMDVKDATAIHTVRVTRTVGGEEQLVDGWIPVNNKNLIEDGIVSRKLPSALWGTKGGSTGYADHNDMKQQPIDHCIGISFDVPEPSYGETLDRISLEDVSSAPIDSAPFPRIQESTLGRPRIVDGSIQRIHDGIASSSTIQARNLLIDRLKLTGMGSFSKNSLDQLASKSSKIYSDAPLIIQM